MRRITRAAVANLLLAFILSGGCVDIAEPAPDGGTLNKCAPGLKPMGPACVPIFDECQDDEVPMLGGGCKRVGVRECLDGWGLAGPPDWKCKPIGPPRTCLKGWEKVAGGWCEPILPKTKCPDGSMEKIGFSTCQPIGDCGTGTWGNIKTTASTIFVDQGHAKTGGKGTIAEPYKTIGEALAHATAGIQIAVAAGTYKEDLSISVDIELAGRCAQMVNILGQASAANGAPAVVFSSSADGSALRGFTISGLAGGIRVLGAQKVILEQLQVLSTGGIGISIEGVAGIMSEVTIRVSRVSGCTGAGISLAGGILLILQSVIKETTHLSGGSSRGILAAASVPSTLTLSDTIIMKNSIYGIGAYGATLQMERCVVMDHAFRGLEIGESGGYFSKVSITDSFIARNGAAGIYIDKSSGELVRCSLIENKETPFTSLGIPYGFGLQAQKSTVTVKDSAVVRNVGAGLVFYSGKGRVERTIVRDTLVDSSDKRAGIGIIIDTFAEGLPASVLVSESVIENNFELGLQVWDSTAQVDKSLIRGTKPSTGANGDNFGIGIGALSRKNITPSTLDVSDCTIDDNAMIGLLYAGADGDVRRTVVRNTGRTPGPKSSFGGLVMQAYKKLGAIGRASSVSVEDSIFEKNRMFGVMAVMGSELTLKRSVLRGSGPPLSGDAASYNGSAGLWIHCSPEMLPAGLSVQATVEDCLLEDNEVWGAMIYRCGKLMLARSAVLRTNGNKTNPTAIGVVSYMDKKNVSAPDIELSMRHVFVGETEGVGVQVADAKGTIEQSAVLDTKEPVGDGISIQGIHRKATLILKQSLVQKSARAGLFFSASGGEVAKSHIRDGIFSIYLESGSDPMILDDNVFQGNKRNPVSIGLGLTPAPLPNVPDLPSPI